MIEPGGHRRSRISPRFVYSVIRSGCAMSIAGACVNASGNGPPGALAPGALAPGALPANRSLMADIERSNAARMSSLVAGRSVIALAVTTLTGR